LDRVRDVAIRFGFTDPIILLSLSGHDVLEDTANTKDDLRAAGFPEESVQIIYCVTDEPATNRSERKRKTLPKIAGNKKAKVVKLCDRIHNMEESKRNNPRTLALYRSEMPEFEAYLYDPTETDLEPLWQHLRSLCAENDQDRSS
jgi:guanosine-3',5'-bis(diphosphate) 3'-pyrophosphohydrolase